MGVGGGYVVKKIAASHPFSHITAVDIDLQIISIGQIFFGLSKYPEVEYAIQDAQLFVCEAAAKKCMYDFIIVDLYIGNDVPMFVETDVFLFNLSQIVQPYGRILINYQHLPEYKKRRKIFESMLQKNFSSVEPFIVYKNRNIEYLLQR